MVVFFDIDGTIIDNHSQIIPESTVKAVEALVKNGHIPVVNTGRPYGHIDGRIKEMAFQGWVCGCGMEIRMDGRQIFHAAPGPELVRETLEIAARCEMEPIYEAEDGIIVFDAKHSTHPRLLKEQREMREKGFRVMDILDYGENPFFQKLVTFDGPGCHREEFLKEMRARYDVIVRDGDLLEIVMKGCSKAAGMEKLLAYLGVDASETLAIGDSTNDLPMFSVAAHTVCMGGGMEELKKHAEFVTAPVLEDGIEKALRHYGLI